METANSNSSHGNSRFLIYQ